MSERPALPSPDKNEIIDNSTNETESSSSLKIIGLALVFVAIGLVCWVVWSRWKKKKVGKTE